jgi:hypothetical protein
LNIAGDVCYTLNSGTCGEAAQRIRYVPEADIKFAKYPALYCVDPARISFRSHQTSCTRNTCVQRGGTLSTGAGDRFLIADQLRPSASAGPFLL